MIGERESFMWSAKKGTMDEETVEIKKIRAPMLNHNARITLLRKDFPQNYETDNFGRVRYPDVTIFSAVNFNSSFS